MRIIVTSRGNVPDSPVDPRFGRAAYFMVADTESGEFQAVANTQNLNAVQGAGIQAGLAVKDLGATAVITGHVGPKAFATLQAAGIKIYLSTSGSVQEALEAFRSGTLMPAARPDVESHW